MRFIPYMGLVAVAGLLLGCTDSSGLNTSGKGGSASGGQLAGTGGSKAAGGSTGGLGGSKSGTGGSVGGLGGSKSGAGGQLGLGGSGGNHGGVGGNSGTGGTTQCIPPPCLAIECPYGSVSASPCGCPTCLRPPDGGIDGGPGRDAGKDAASMDGKPCLPVACPAILCRYGYVPSPTPCGCPTCVPGDAGSIDADKTDALLCPPIVCPMLACLDGLVSSPTPCGCPTCGIVTPGP